MSRDSVPSCTLCGIMGVFICEICDAVSADSVSLARDRTHQSKQEWFRQNQQKINACVEQLKAEVSHLSQNPNIIVVTRLNWATIFFNAARLAVSSDAVISARPADAYVCDDITLWYLAAATVMKNTPIMSERSAIHLLEVLQLKIKEKLPKKDTADEQISEEHPARLILVNAYISRLYLNGFHTKALCEFKKYYGDPVSRFTAGENEFDFHGLNSETALIATGLVCMQLALRNQCENAPVFIVGKHGRGVVREGVVIALQILGVALKKNNPTEGKIESSGYVEFCTNVRRMGYQIQLEEMHLVSQNQSQNNSAEEKKEREQIESSFAEQKRSILCTLFARRARVASENFEREWQNTENLLLTELDKELSLMSRAHESLVAIVRFFEAAQENHVAFGCPKIKKLFFKICCDVRHAIADEQEKEFGSLSQVFFDTMMEIMKTEEAKKRDAIVLESDNGRKNIKKYREHIKNIGKCIGSLMLTEPVLRNEIERSFKTELDKISDGYALSKKNAEKDAYVESRLTLAHLPFLLALFIFSFCVASGIDINVNVNTDSHIGVFLKAYWVPLLLGCCSAAFVIWSERVPPPPKEDAVVPRFH